MATDQGFRPVHSLITYAVAAVAIITLQAGQGGGVEVTPLAPVDTTATPSTGVLVDADRPVRQLANTMPLEYGVLFQGGVGLTEDRNSFRFLLAGAHVSKVLTPEIGTGALRGNFEYAVEFFPYWQSFTPTFNRIVCQPNSDPAVQPYVCSPPFRTGGTYTGLSMTPIILRWNFTHGTRLMPFVQGAGGLLWTNHKYPGYGGTDPRNAALTGPNADTSVWNFTPQGGVGVHYFVRPRRSVDFTANAVHISSASLGDRNPGVNASVQFSLGYSWWK